MVPHTQVLPVPPQALASPGLRLAGALLTVVLILVTLVIGYVVWAIVSWTKSTTPAKQLLRMQVIDSRTGQPLTFGGMLMRQVVWTLVLGIGSSITFGILGIVDAFFVFTASRQRLLDRMSNTLVVRTPG
ncbi:MAG TPA: RDD family protein [Mycobacteriales bacterium]|nr:RDD family protein [Mycobacteriales bacterium]